MSNILVVLDKGFRFKPPQTAEFTYTVLVATLAAHNSVTKAHRSPTDDPEVVGEFKFTDAALAPFDEVWLIGHAGRNDATADPEEIKIDADEILAITKFMESGGGVFATGDHSSIGSKMCGEVPRVRAMRKWFAETDPLRPAGFPGNSSPTGMDRADTIQPGLHGDGGTYFENQSDSRPQTIQRFPPAGPTHPILRNGDHDVTVYPDHMHEGDAIPGWDGFDWAQPLPGSAVPEFRTLTGAPNERPQVIATGDGLGHATPSIQPGFGVGTATPKTVGTLAAYDGFTVGVGRIVTGSTFHHYVDVNLIGTKQVDTADDIAKVGEDAQENQGFNWPDAADHFADIKAVYRNIASWIARPRRAIRLILERSTFGQDEVQATPGGLFERAVFVTVEGFRPSDFPGGLDNVVNPSDVQLNDWAPSITPDSSHIEVKPTGVSSSDPELLERFQTFTFEYKLTFLDNDAFGFGGASDDIELAAELTLGGLAMADSALTRLVKTANPFMLDLADGNDTYWLSSDVRVFAVVEGDGMLGHDLPVNATPAQAAAFIAAVIADIDDNQFGDLETGEAAAPHSLYPTTSGGDKVYNFAIARVRLRGDMAAAPDVRVFFRIFESQTTAALTYLTVDAGTPGALPVGSYRRTDAPARIALPGISADGTQYISFPCFATERAMSPAGQDDLPNKKTIPAPGGTEKKAFFGCLVDTNLPDVPYLEATPGSGGAVSLAQHLMGEHQCIVAQIEFPGTPIVHGANPATSDKLAQRNIALSQIANPGTDASRIAAHTFEIEATPAPIAGDWPPDELMLEWSGAVPEGATVTFYLPTWSAAKVIELADRFYARHELRMIDDATIECPAGGTRYIPLPKSLARQVGLMSAAFPLGVRKGQRHHCLVRQVTNSMRRVKQEPAKVTPLGTADAAGLAADLRQRPRPGVAVMRADQLDMASSEPVLVETPRAEEAERAAARRWREVVGAFMLAIPVEDKAALLLPHLRLLSVMRWRLGLLRPWNRWYPVLRRYLEALADKVRALGGNPDLVPATPDGMWDGLLDGEDGDGKDKEHRFLLKLLCLLLALILLVLLIIAYILLT